MKDLLNAQKDLNIPQVDGFICSRWWCDDLVWKGHHWKYGSTCTQEHFMTLLFAIHDIALYCIVYLFFRFSLLSDLCTADPGGGRSGHRSLLLVRRDRLQRLVSVRRQRPERLLQRLPQLLGIHHRPQHHGAHFTLCQVSKTTHTHSAFLFLPILFLLCLRASDGCGGRYHVLWLWECNGALFWHLENMFQDFSRCSFKLLTNQLRTEQLYVVTVWVWENESCSSHVCLLCAQCGGDSSGPE